MIFAWWYRVLCDLRKLERLHLTDDIHNCAVTGLDDTDNLVPKLKFCWLGTTIINLFQCMIEGESGHIFLILGDSILQIQSYTLLRFFLNIQIDV